LITFGRDNGLNAVSDSFKYFCYYRFNRYVKDPTSFPLPEKYFDFHPSPAIKSYMDRKLGTRGRRSTFFLQSLMYLKRILKPLPKEFIEKSLEKHSLTLSTPSPYPSDELLSFTEWFIDSNVKLNYKKSDLDRVPALSSSASFNTGCKKGGVQGEVSLNLPCTKGPMSLRKFAIINNATKTQVQLSKDQADQKLSDLIRGNARPATVLEPLKVRIVTCEDASNFRLKPVQEILWEHLLRGEEFCLTRGEDIFPPLNKHLLPLEKLPLWISGDYSAATDNLNRHVINNVLTQLSAFLPSPYSSLLIKNGGSHFIKYRNGTIIEQTNGQLMGSLTSFPLLCYINYIAYNYSRSRSPEDFSSFVLINGDDILFRATEKGYDIWKDVVKQFGLSPSPGKNYCSERFFMINSRLFTIKGGKISEEPFINWALLNSSQLKSELRIDYGNPFSPPYGQLLRTLFRQAQPSLIQKRRLYGLFLSIHKKKLRRCYNDLLIPSCLGGMGGLTIEEFRKGELLTRGQREKMVNGFRFRLGLFALRKHLIPAARSHIRRQNTIMGEAVNPYLRGSDPENPDPPTYSNQLSFVNKGGQIKSFPSIKTWLRKTIGRSSFCKSRKPDGVPNLL